MPSPDRPPRRLHELAAVHKGIRQRFTTAVTELYQDAKKPALFSGLVKTYSPLDEGDVEKLPEERKPVARVARLMLQEVSRLTVDLLDATASIDHSNREATADIVIDDVVIVTAVPIMTLLFLEGELERLKTTIAAFPVPDEAETWTLDEQSGLYRTAEVQSYRTKKLKERLVLFEPTKDQPGQAQVFDIDKVVGTYGLTKLSGGLPTTESQAMLGRLAKLQDAVKQARERANMAGIAEKKIGGALLKYVFSGS